MVAVEKVGQGRMEDGMVGYRVEDTSEVCSEAGLTVLASSEKEAEATGPSAVLCSSGLKRNRENRVRSPCCPAESPGGSTRQMVRRSPGKSRQRCKNPNKPCPR